VNTTLTDRPSLPNANLDENGPMLLTQSKLGLASFILGLVSILIIMGLLLVVIVFAFLSPGMDRESVRSLDFVVAGGLILGLLATVILPLIGVCLGLAGLARKNCRRSFAVTGLISNAVILTIAVSMIAIYFLLLKAVEHAISC
jgi:hypothetical protein